MRALFTLIILASTIPGCSNDDESNQVAGDIVGQWKLIYLHKRSWDSYISDESAKNIVYDFRSNGILIVRGNQTAPHKDGQHNYSFGEETIVIGGQSYQSQMVNIENQKWFFSFSAGQMNISEMDDDGGTLTFVKK